MIFLLFLSLGFALSNTYKQLKVYQTNIESKTQNVNITPI